MNLNNVAQTAIRRNARWLLRLTALMICWDSLCSAEPMQTKNIEPISNYCITETAPKQRPPNPALYTTEPAKKLRVDFTVQGKLFHIVTIGNSRLDLQNEDNSLIAMATALQYDYGGIENLVLDKNGWLWIDAGETDYIAHIDLNQLPPTISPPEKLSELKQTPCSLLGWLFGCIPAQGRYSPTLGRAFVTGYPDAIFGLAKPVTLEVVAGQRKRMPVMVRNATFEADLPNIQGVLLRGASQEPLFYDGVSVLPLLQDSASRSVKGEKKGWHLYQSPVAQRVFLTNMISENQQFLVELKPDRTQVSFSIPEELPQTRTEFFVVAPDNRLFGVTRHGVITRANALKSIPEQ